ncbi:MAG TPA: (2Fe-2S)-binding protein [Vicinamibacteria bacterium]|jgi:aerobic-type carbon monoxide dehydrogenase small subunit (CoxS/CutS family)
MPPFRLAVNGATRDVDAAADMPLLWVLRDRLGLTGTKYGCGVGICGACTVHLDGRAARSCQVALKDAAGPRITTIEGLAPDGTHPVQRAWLEEDVAQCGFCQAGMIMSAAAFLAEKPQPTDAEIDAAMSDSVCRCGTYQRIRRAIRLAAGGAR